MMKLVSKGIYENTNLLIIGNGFDKAHGLPTGYGDFLNELNKGTNFYNHLNKMSREEIKKYELLSSGCLIKYLKKTNIKKGWIDFENEIKSIIDAVSEFPNILIKRTNYNKEIEYFLESSDRDKLTPFLLYVLDQKNFYFPKIFFEQWKNEDISRFYGIVHDEIKALIELFKEYIAWIELNYINNLNAINPFIAMSVSNILTFNYTDTYREIYNSININKLDEEDVCWVHGRVFDDGSGDIVMGSGSDYYDRKYEDFLDLFKFYQKYKYRTDTSYLKWTKDDNEKEFDNIYIFGHSLDPTDADILKPFLESQSSIKIYYRTNSEKYRFEKNLLAILGKDMFMEKLGGENANIGFIEIKNDK